ncbi:odorant receptor 65a [Drosophila serrata]|uniref:odorant receptor 65a n=1 Tax=Drosophila serrata TaxID=7274 RepID=UPI000A1D0836|nr:odorant receptor 65a [Drosophila serrata]
MAEPFVDGWRAYKNPRLQRQHITTFYTRNIMKTMGLYTNSEERRDPKKVAWHYFIYFQCLFSYGSLITGVLESMGDLVNLGRDLVFAITFLFIILRIVFFGFYADDFDEVIVALDEFYRREPISSAVEEVKATKRFHFLALSVILTLWSSFIVAFCVIKISTPFWMESQILPFHVVWPYQLDDPSKHLICHVIIYFHQATIFTYLMVWLCFEENMAASIFFEMTTALKVLGIELRSLQEFCKGDDVLLARELKRLTQLHQSIIHLSDRLNHIFSSTFIAQIIVNFLLVSLSAFEVLVARKNPKVVVEYLTIICMTLGHLSYWSKFGDMLSEESMEVANAAYEAYDPRFGTKATHRDIGLLIMRAQTPLIIRGRPFPPFNMENYMSILNQCYSILTLLMNTLE